MQKALSLLSVISFMTIIAAEQTKLKVEFIQYNLQEKKKVYIRSQPKEKSKLIKRVYNFEKDLGTYGNYTIYDITGIRDAIKRKQNPWYLVDGGFQPYRGWTRDLNVFWEFTTKDSKRRIKNYKVDKQFHEVIVGGWLSDFNFNKTDLIVNVVAGQLYVNIEGLIERPPAAYTYFHEAEGVLFFSHAANDEVGNTSNIVVDLKKINNKKYEFLVYYFQFPKKFTIEIIGFEKIKIVGPDFTRTMERLTDTKGYVLRDHLGYFKLAIEDAKKRAKSK